MLRATALAAFLALTFGEAQLAMWSILAGGDYCHVVNSVGDFDANGACVSDGIGYHGNYEDCVIESARAVYATASFFATETYFDYIQLGGSLYSGSNGPVNVLMQAGSTLRW